ncbi:MAG: hypothetical protein LBK53_06880 [Heliobacteriaceae bacterium]|jgi:hypothetical protein|nr:hypothetical protein [Heliobacteriaceae bacterium]
MKIFLSRINPKLAETGRILAEIPERIDLSKNGLKELERKIVKAPYEIGVLINPETGQIVQKQAGFADSVEMDLTMGKGCIFTHNHPDGIPLFSYNDVLASFSVKFKELRAVADGFAASVTLPENFKAKSIPKEVINDAFKTRMDKIGIFCAKLLGLELIPAGIYTKCEKETEAMLREAVAKDLFLLPKYNAAIKEYSRITWEHILEKFTNLVPGTRARVEKL